jgi:hypothetical protein
VDQRDDTEKSKTLTQRSVTVPLHVRDVKKADRHASKSLRR